VKNGGDFDFFPFLVFPFPFLTSIPCKKRPVMGKKWQGTKVLTLPQKMENGKMGNGNGKTPIYANIKGGTQKQHVPQLLRGC
jgi:hypothetical protein